MDVKDRIAKLLALSKSPNEHEAKFALLKARELMAEHKLRPEMCQRAGNDKVLSQLTGVKVSKTKDAWAVDLAVIVGEHYCCRTFRYHIHGKRMYEVGIVGLEDDLAICKKIYLYAYDCCRKYTETVFRQNRELSPSYRRSLADAYGKGFVLGVRDALKRQTEEKPQEWGLVLVVPKAVDDYMASWGAPQVFNKKKEDDKFKKAYRSAGYGQGLKFDPSHHIGSGAEQLPSGN